MMSQSQRYLKGEALDSQHAKSNKRSKLSERVATLVVCVLLATAFIVTYLLFEILKTRDILRNLELRSETAKPDVTERPPEIKPCNTAQPTCPEPEVKIITQSCSTIQPTTLKPPEVNMDEPCYKCEEGWEPHAGMCYYFSTCKCSWKDSREECKAKGGDLVKIDSREEQIYLNERVEGIMRDPEDRFWIGLTDSVEEGTWVWVDGSPLNTSLSFWRKGQPNNRDGSSPEGEDCGRIGIKGGDKFHKSWLDYYCKMFQRSICEKPAATR